MRVKADSLSCSEQERSNCHAKRRWGASFCEITDASVTPPILQEVRSHDRKWRSRDARSLVPDVTGDVIVLGMETVVRTPALRLLMWRISRPTPPWIRQFRGITHSIVSLRWRVQKNSMRAATPMTAGRRMASWGNPPRVATTVTAMIGPPTSETHPAHDARRPVWRMATPNTA